MKIARNDLDRLSNRATKYKYKVLQNPKKVQSCRRLTYKESLDEIRLAPSN